MKNTDYELLRLRKIIDDQLEEIGYLKSSQIAILETLDEYIDRCKDEGHEAAARKLEALKRNVMLRVGE